MQIRICPQNPYFYIFPIIWGKRKADSLKSVSILPTASQTLFHASAPSILMVKDPKEEAESQGISNLDVLWKKFNKKRNYQKKKHLKLNHFHSG